MEFKLSAPIKVSVDGDFQEYDVLELSAPPAKEKKYPIKLRKGFMKASTDMMKFADPDRKATASDAEKAENKDVKPRDIEQMLYASDINIEKYLDDFKSLMLINGVCKVGVKTEINLLPKHWDDITAQDVDRLVGEYLVNFYLPLWDPKEDTSN